MNVAASSCSSGPQMVQLRRKMMAPEWRRLVCKAGVHGLFPALSKPLQSPALTLLLAFLAPSAQVFSLSRAT